MTNKIYKFLNLFKNLTNPYLAISKLQPDSNTISAMIFVKEGRPMINFLKTIIYPLGGNMSRNWVRTIVVYLRQLNSLRRKNGVAFVVKYQKACYVLLQQIISGHKLYDMNGLGLRVSRSSSGLPRIIPAYHRKLILQGNTLIIRFWLSMFSIYRDIKFPGKLKLSTITAISTASDISPISDFIYNFKITYTKPEDFLFEPKLDYMFQMLTSGPQGNGKMGIFNTHPQSVIDSLKLFIDPCNHDLFTSLKKVMSLLNMGSLLDTMEKIISCTDWKSVNPRSSYLGRLAIKEESAGKVRVFAMVDPWTQWVLNPLHSRLFSILRRFKTDGTFNQLKPLKEVPFADGPIYSFDLSAATDRLPLSLQKDILNIFFGDNLGDFWATLLVSRKYKTPSSFELRNCQKVNLPKDVSYAVGQPMGALSSWAMLALTHHYIVHYSAWRYSSEYPVGSTFTKYAILGDDIVIWDKQVALGYLKVLSTLGVEVGLAKSIISPKGEGLEFAKRMIFRGNDVSPIPFKELASAHNQMSMLLEFQKKYKMDNNSILRFLGYGYKVDNTKFKTLIVRILHLLPDIPLNSDQLRQLFSPTISINSTLILKTSPRIFQRVFVRLVWATLHKLHFKVSTMIKDLENYDSDLYFPYIGEKVEGVNFVTHLIKPEALIRMGTLDYYYSKYRTDLVNMLEYLSLSIKHIKPIYELTFHEYWDSPERLMNLSYNLGPYTYSFINAVNIMFWAEEELSRIQVDLLINPKIVISKTPLKKEERRRLKLWSFWFKTISRVVRYN